MYHVGDLIRVHSIEEGRSYLVKFIGKEFTITDISGEDYYCIRGGMKYPRWFRPSELELVENISKYSIGTVVEDKRYNGYINKYPIGVVEHSNRLGSIVRFSIRRDCGEHSSMYISNRNLRRMR